MLKPLMHAVLLLLVAVSSSFAPKKPLHAPHRCGPWFQVDNNSAVTYITQASATSTSSSWISGSIPPGSSDNSGFISGAGATFRIAIQFGPVHAAGRLRLYDAYGNLAACIDVPANTTQVLSSNFTAICAVYLAVFDDGVC